MISRRSLLLIFLWILAVAIPTSYSKGRIFQTRRIELANGVERKSDMDSWPIVFALTVREGEPDSVHQIALIGVLLSGICIVSMAFDFAPKRQVTRELKTQLRPTEQEDVTRVEEQEQ